MVMKKTTFDILIPKLSDEIIDCQIARWHKDVGDFVKEGDVLVELETEKTTIEIESPTTGTLEEIYVFDGEEVIETERIGVINSVDYVQDEDDELVDLDETLEHVEELDDYEDENDYADPDDDNDEMDDDYSDFDEDEVRKPQYIAKSGDDDSAME